MLLIDGGPAASQLQRHLQRVVEASRVLTSSTLAGALRLLRKETIGCVITELVLPDARHDLVLPALRRLSPRVPIVVVTSHGSEELARMALKAGAANYIPKRDGAPIDLGSAVRAALGRSVISQEPLTLASSGGDTPCELVDSEIICASTETRLLLIAADRAVL